MRFADVFAFVGEEDLNERVITVCIHFEGYAVDTGFVIQPGNGKAIGGLNGFHVAAEGSPEGLFDFRYFFARVHEGARYDLKLFLVSVGKDEITERKWDLVSFYFLNHLAAALLQPLLFPSLLAQPTIPSGRTSTTLKPN